MAKSKAVREVVEHIAPASKAVKAREALKAPIGRQAARQAMDDIIAEHSASIESMIKETEDLLTTAEQDLRMGPSSSEIEAIRRPMIEDPDEAIESWAQTRTPEEFAIRYRRQLTNKRYAARSIMNSHEAWDEDLVKESHAALDAGGNPPLNIEAISQWEAEIQRSQARDMLVQTKVSRPFRGDVRKMAILDEWMEGSPYTRPGKKQPQVFFHVDRQADPLTTKMEDLIQLTDEANELGLHSGTMAAAERATYRDVNFGRQSHQVLDEWITDIAEAANLPYEDVRFTIGQTIIDYMEGKFRAARQGRGPDVGYIFQEMEEELGMALLEGGLPVQSTLQTLKSIIRTIPIPDTTPHFFRGKNGLVMEDRGGWFPTGVKAQLSEIFDNDPIIDTLRGTKDIREYIESKGFDHVIYHNTVEDRGMPSIIVWNPDLMMSLFDPRLSKTGGRYEAQVLGGMILGFLGLGEEDAELREEL